MLEVARKFPVMDMCVPGNRVWRGAKADELEEFRLNVVNWLTIVDDFVLGGVDQITKGLDPKIA
ncbi:MAG: hypothetical protein U1E41_04105 [Paracoccus sp. (in: a-proteobacteria)]